MNKIKIIGGSIFLILGLHCLFFFPAYKPLSFYFQQFIVFLYFFAGVYFLTK